MKIIENKKITFKGVQLTDDKKNVIDTLNLFRTILENSQYDSAGSLMRAIKVEAALKEEEGNISLEDVDFEFVKKWSLEYKPLLQKGLIFAEFYTQLGS